MSNLETFLEQAFPWGIALVLAITLHEAGHGLVARWFGDLTATRMGRVTLNPLKHVDLVGTILLPGALILSGSPFLFGYAKPVPVYFPGLRPYKIGVISVALAGICVNLILASLSALILGQTHPSEGSFFFTLLTKSIQINIMLAAFNLIPLPPLDGSRVVGVLIPSIGRFFDHIEKYGFFILMFLLAFPWVSETLLGRDINPLGSMITTFYDLLIKVPLSFLP